MNRQSWDTYFLNVARTVATRSTCLRRQVGAILVRDRHIIATGYNGAPTGLSNCCDVGTCYKNILGIPSGQGHDVCCAVHAEANTIVQAAKFGIATKGTTLYTRWLPCTLCARLLVNAGISVVVYENDDYPSGNSLAIFQQAKVTVVRKETCGQQK